MQLVIGNGQSITLAVLKGYTNNFLPAPGMCPHVHYIGIGSLSTYHRVRITLAWLIADLLKQPVAGSVLHKNTRQNFVVPHESMNYFATQYGYGPCDRDAIIIRLEKAPIKFDLLLAVEDWNANVDTRNEATRRIGIDGETKVEISCGTQTFNREGDLLRGAS